MKAAQPQVWTGDAVRDIAGIQSERAVGRASLSQKRSIAQVFSPRNSGHLMLIVLSVARLPGASSILRWRLSTLDSEGKPNGMSLPPFGVGVLAAPLGTEYACLYTNVGPSPPQLNANDSYALVVDDLEDDSSFELPHLSPPQATGVGALWREGATGDWAPFETPDALAIETWMLP